MAELAHFVVSVEAVGLNDTCVGRAAPKGPNGHPLVRSSPTYYLCTHY